MTETAVMPGAEAVFIAGNETGVLLSHGYTGTPQSMRYVGEYLAERGGVTVWIPRLPGHGTRLEDMAATTAGDWLRGVRTALTELQRQCSRIFLVGLSMGGTLMLHLAATRPELIQGLVVINAPVFLDNPDFAAVAFADDAPEFLPKISADIKRPDTDELSYQGAPVATARHLYALMAATRELLPRVRCPLLAFYSREDHVVPPANGPYVLERVSCADKRLVTLENSYHVATLDNDRELIASETLRFIEQRIQAESAASMVAD